MKKGQILFIPAYWWYSIEFGENASIASFKYKTYMNMVAISPHIIMNLLQSQNVKRNNLKKMVINESIISEQPTTIQPQIIDKNNKDKDTKNTIETALPSNPIVLPSETSLPTDSIEN